MENYRTEAIVIEVIVSELLGEFGQQVLVIDGPEFRKHARHLSRFESDDKLLFELRASDWVEGFRRAGQAPTEKETAECVFTL